MGWRPLWTAHPPFTLRTTYCTYCTYCILQKEEIWKGVTHALLTHSHLKDRATQLLIKYKSGALVTQCTEMVNILGKDLLASATSAYTVLKSAFVLSSIVVLFYILFCPLISITSHLIFQRVWTVLLSHSLFGNMILEKYPTTSKYQNKRSQ